MKKFLSVYGPIALVALVVIVLVQNNVLGLGSLVARLRMSTSPTA